MTDQPDARIEAASAAIDRACAELQARDPEAAARYLAQQDETARVLRETCGDVPAVVNVSWTELRPRIVTSKQRVAQERAAMEQEIRAEPNEVAGRAGDPLGAVDGTPRP